MEQEQLDVETPFLHGSLVETIHKKQLEGFEVEDPNEQVCLLKMSLYRLKQWPLQWYLKNRCVHDESRVSDIKL